MMKVCPFCGNQKWVVRDTRGNIVRWFDADAPLLSRRWGHIPCPICQTDYEYCPLDDPDLGASLSNGLVGRKVRFNQDVTGADLLLDYYADSRMFKVGDTGTIVASHVDTGDVSIESLWQNHLTLPVYAGVGEDIIPYLIFYVNPSWVDIVDEGAE